MRACSHHVFLEEWLKWEKTSLQTGIDLESPENCRRYFTAVILQKIISNYEFRNNIDSFAYIIILSGPRKKWKDCNIKKTYDSSSISGRPAIRKRERFCQWILFPLGSA